MGLTQEEQQLIARAIAEGRLRRIPTGQAGRIRHRRGRPKNLRVVQMVRILARQCLTDAEIAEHVGKTRKAVERIRDRHNIEAGYWRAKRAKITGTPKEMRDG